MLPERRLTTATEATTGEYYDQALPIRERTDSLMRHNRNYPSVLEKPVSTRHWEIKYFQRRLYFSGTECSMLEWLPLVHTIDISDGIVVHHDQLNRVAAG